MHCVGGLSSGAQALGDVNANGGVDIVVAQLYVGFISQLPCSNATPAPTPTTPPGTPGPTDGCVKGQVKGSEVLLIGDSFIALSLDITKELEQLARSAGSIGASENYRDNSVSRTRLSGGISPFIPTQYSNGRQQGVVKVVIMDGGGNDMLQGSCSSPPTSSCADIQNAVNAAITLMQQMASDGVEHVVYMFYANPVNNSTLQERLDVLRPLIQLTYACTTFHIANCCGSLHVV